MVAHAIRSIEDIDRGRVELAWKELLAALGYDPEDPHLVGTPERVARFHATWNTQGKDPPKLTVFPNDGTDQVIAVGGIRMHSLCAHHGLPFVGVAAVGYIPRLRLVGLSKLARVVDHYSHRFTVQETITTKVAKYLEEQLEPVGVGVVIKAQHMCMSLRGVQKHDHFTVTSAMRGAFRKDMASRDELLRLVQ